jgi:hypothetical protein
VRELLRATWAGHDLPTLATVALVLEGQVHVSDRGTARSALSAAGHARADEERRKHVIASDRREAQPDQAAKDGAVAVL